MDLFSLSINFSRLGIQRLVSDFYTEAERRGTVLEGHKSRVFIVFMAFPSFMRLHVAHKTGYLPGFLANSENFSFKAAEEFISAPPDVIFLYHIWSRLLAHELIARPINVKEFEDFLQQLPEWRPENWIKAPEGYVKLIGSRDYIKIENLQTLQENVLPLVVRQAFLGWKNYFIEGSKINDLKPTFSQIQEFLNQYPHYARQYWRNIQEANQQKVAGLSYLNAFVYKTFIPDAVVPQEELPPFIRVALYNAQQASKNL